MFLGFREAERNACFGTVIALGVGIKATSAVCKTIKIICWQCILNYHHVQMTFISFFQPLILLDLYITLTLIAISQPLSDLRTQILQSTQCTVVFTKPRSYMKTHPDHVCIVLWLNETSVFFFINSLFEKSYWYHRLRNTQLHSFLSLQWFIVTRVLSEPQHIKPRSFEMTKPVCCQTPLVHNVIHLPFHA